MTNQYGERLQSTFIFGHPTQKYILMDKVDNMVRKPNNFYNKEDNPIKNNPLDLTILLENHFNNLQIQHKIFKINHLLVERRKEKVSPLNDEDHKLKLLSYNVGKRSLRSMTLLKGMIAIHHSWV